MIRPPLRRIVLALVTAPLALGLAACNKDKDASAPSGEPIAKIAAPANRAWSDVVAKTEEGGYRMGNPDAPIKLVEYGSLTCSHCAEFADKGAGVLRDTFVASGRVSYEFRNFVRDPIDITSAMLARCGQPEGFFALTDQLFANQPAMFDKWNAAGQAGQTAVMNQPDAKRFIAIGEAAGLTEFVSSRGIAKDQANTCLANVKEAQDLADKTQKQGEEYDISGTPTFLINGAKFDGNTWEAVKARLEQLGAR
jgi:protein-disulfide isomerase